ncbi:trypsin-like peptidase domain-containing protein [Rubripirellula amarantea]|nr:trypsin-like peptidase domain-containing protein [Rubripirellula amarantea]MDA8743132.1 trypsin-like peptidase domain-containing protein [Rubripirellula amarantea]
MSSMAFASDPDSQLNDLRMTPTVRAIQRVSPAVVNIHGQKTVRSTAAGMAGAEGPDSFRQVNGMGTGVVIDPRGYVVTNFHVVEDVDDIRVTLSNGETTSAQLVASRVKSDLALIKVDSSSLLPTIPRGTSSDLMVGEPVIAIGNAFGYVHTSTQGIVSALHRDVPVNETQEYRDLIQISAGINPGNSGGPLLNIKGEMIGVNVAVRVGAQQIAFAIPIDQVVEIVTEMIEIHNEQRLLTGVRATGGPRDGDGITIANVSASSPAARDGLKPGDRVIRVGSQPVDDRLDFALAMLEVEPGRAMEFEVERSGKRFDLAVVGEAPQSASPQSVAAAAWTMLGIQAKPVAESTMRRLNARMRTKYTGGLYIQAVRPGSAADQQGIVPGDVLLGIHGFETTTMAGLGSILELPEIKRGPKARFYLVRREQTLYGHMQIAAMPSSTHR